MTYINKKTAPRAPLPGPGHEDDELPRGPNSIFDVRVVGHPDTKLQALAPLYPDLGMKMMSYRAARLKEAKVEARALGHAGAMFPLECAVTGRNVCPAGTLNQVEIHTTGDVAMAHRLQYVGVFSHNFARFFTRFCS